MNTLARFDRDVLSQAGVTDLILLEGAADLLLPNMTVPKDAGSPGQFPEPGQNEGVTKLHASNVAGRRGYIRIATTCQ